MDPAEVFGRAIRAHQEGRLDEARQLYDEVLRLAPNHPDTLHYRGITDLQQNRYADALTWFDRTVAAAPAHPGAQTNRAAALLGLERYEEALAAAERALQFDQRSLSAYNNRAAALDKLGRHAEAVETCRRAQALGLEDAQHHFRHASALKGLARYEEALAACEKAIAHAPDVAETHRLRAAVLGYLNRSDEALASNERALALAPASAEAYHAHAAALAAAHRPLETVAACDKALGLRPGFLPALLSRATALQALGRFPEVIADCNEILKQEPDAVEAIHMRGLARRALKRSEEALADFEVVIDLRPDVPLVRGEIVHLCLLMCEWEGLDTRIEDILARMDAGELAAQPFVMLALPSSASQQQKAASHYFNFNSKGAGGAARQTRSFNEKLRIGYFSSDFHDHPVGHLIVGMLEAHDRTQFEVIGFTFARGGHDPTHQRIKNACDRFIDVSAMLDAEVAALSRELGIHVAVDLNGYTALSRPNIFAYGAAPVQVNFLGYPGTMGVSCFHYIIGDQIVIPPEDYPYFDERVISMPHAHLVSNDIKGRIPARTFTRGDFGLPNTGFIFCCFNASFKLTPDVFSVWMRLLKRVEGSVLWLLEYNAAAVGNLKRAAREAGVAPERLIFARRTEGLEYLARYRIADLFLDTFHYNAHATASEALMMGLPVVTRKGKAFAGRVAASLLTTLGMPDLIAETTETYEALALRLATQPETYADVRRRVTENGRSHPLFDTARYTRAFETACRVMWDRYAAGLAPDHIQVPDS